MTRDLCITVTNSSELESHLVRYERIRVPFSLPIVQVTRTQSGTELVFCAYPPFVQLESADPRVVLDALRFLVEVEQAWGSSLASCVSTDELALDVRRRTWAVGPCFFHTNCPQSAADWMRQRLGLDSGIESFMGLAMALKRARPDVYERLGLGLSDEDRIRWLLDQARASKSNGDWEGGLEHALEAWRLRVGDLDTGVVCLELARRCRACDDVEGIAASLGSRPLVPPGVARSLARYHRSRGRTDTALALAQRAVADDSEQSWSELALSAHAVGRTDLVLRALVALAGLGNEGALAQLRKRNLPTGTWAGILGRWPGPDTDQVFLWKLEAHHQEERLEEVLMLVSGASVNRLHRLSLSHVVAVVEAARRLGRGHVQRTLSALEGAARHPAAQACLIQGFAEFCIEQQHYDQVLELHVLHPDALGPGLRMAAFSGLRRWEPLLMLAKSTGNRVVELEAGVRLHFGLGTTASDAWILGLLTHSADVRSRARQLVQQLGETGADQPVLLQLRDALNVQPGAEP